MRWSKVGLGMYAKLMADSRREVGVVMNQVAKK